MNKTINIFKHFLHIFSEWFLIILVFSVFFVRSSRVQTYLAKIATDYFSQEWNTVVSIEKLDILFFNTVNLKNIVLLNQTKSDTILELKSVIVRFDGWKAFRNQVQLNSIILEDGAIKLSKEKTTGEINIRFLIDYFQTKEQKEESIMPMSVGRIRLKNMRFSFDNELEPLAQHQGMDYQHLYFSNIYLDTRNVSIKNYIISGEIKQLSVDEKSGIRIEQWRSTQVMVSEQGLKIDELEIYTDRSFVKSNSFQLKYNRWRDFMSFVDSVSFDSDIENSKVSMIDIAIFAPPLIGMDQVFELKGKVSKFVKNLKVSDFELKTGQNTILRGTINLPDFRNIQESFYQQRIDYALIDMLDIQGIKLPNDNSTKFIQLEESLLRLGYIQASNIRLDGIFSQFVLSSDEIYTQLGSIELENGLMFTHNPENESFIFTRSHDSKYDLQVNLFHIGKFLDNSSVGFVDGSFFVSGEAFSFSDIEFHRIEGIVNRCDIADYSYSNISVSNAHLANKVLYAEVAVNDKNLELFYRGTIDLNDTPSMHMTINVKKALLGKLHIIDNDSANIVGQITLESKGLNPNTMEGILNVVELQYVQGDKQIDIPTIDVQLKRESQADVYSVHSSLLDAEFIGKIKNFQHIKEIIVQQFRQVVPRFNRMQAKNVVELVQSEDCLEFEINLLNTETFWDIFYPVLYISPNTTIKGDYDASKRFFEMHINSDKVMYNEIEARNLYLYQFVDIDRIEAEYTIKTLTITDSLIFDELHFIGVGNGHHLESQLTWNSNGENDSKIDWITQLTTNSRIELNLKPSYFSINKQKWTVEKEATVVLDTKTIEVESFKITSQNQFISVNGKVSENDNDKLHFYIDEIDLQKLSQMVGLDISFQGKLNGWGYIVNPYDNMHYLGDMKLNNFSVNKETVGDVYVMSQWNDKQKHIDISGDLIYKNHLSCQFVGTYDIFSQIDNINFDVLFDHTDVAFVSAFIDELIIDDISGSINGKLALSGTFKRPIISGNVDIENVQAKVVMLGTHFSVNGKMYADKDGFYIDYMPITDMEGNTGALTGAVFHTDYNKWNVNVEINIEEDYYKRDPNRSWVRMPLERFLLLNTDESNNSLYYGKAYVTGTIGIFGSPSNLDINVTARSQRGTNINLDFFAQRKLNEDDFIEFYIADSIEHTKRAINYSGVSMNLDFDITKDAQLRLIFNKLTGDEMNVIGVGNLVLSLDKIGQFALDGKYTTQTGSKYNFVLGPIKETFFIEEGGTVVWTGDPYQAMINVKAYTELRGNLADLSPELLTNANQPINCYINLTESLMKPTIVFEIKAPKALEQDKMFLSQIATDEDELNRQFFSLLLWKKFQPMKGSTRASGGAALDFASNQINSLLSQMSKEYQLNVSLTSDAPGKNEYAIGIKKGFLDDQLIVSGMFGSRNMTTADQSQSTFIGDIEIEYKLNKEGTFRINVFNESNDNRTLQSTNRGLTKQGIGVYYRENFNTLNDFRLLQQMMDIARRKGKKRHPIRRKKQQIRIE